MTGLLNFLAMYTGLSIFISLALIFLIGVMIKKYFDMSKDIDLIQQDVRQLEETLYNSYEVQKQLLEAVQKQRTTELESSEADLSE